MYRLIVLMIFSALLGSENLTIDKERVYDVYKRLVFVDIKVAEVSSKIIKKVEIEGRDCYYIVLRVRSASIVGYIYEFDREFHSWSTTDSLLTLKFEKWIKQRSGATTHTLIDFDQEAHLARYSYPDTATVEIFPETRDFVASICALSTLNFNQIKTGDSLVSNSLEEDKKLPRSYRIEVGELEKTKLRGYECWRAKGLSSNIELGITDKKEEKKEAEIWMTADEKNGRFPIRIKYGSLRIEIK